MISINMQYIHIIDISLLTVTFLHDVVFSNIHVKQQCATWLVSGKLNLKPLHTRMSNLLKCGKMGDIKRVGNVK